MNAIVTKFCGNLPIVHIALALRTWQQTGNSQKKKKKETQPMRNDMVELPSNPSNPSTTQPQSNKYLPRGHGLHSHFNGFSPSGPAESSKYCVVSWQSDFFLNFKSTHDSLPFVGWFHPIGQFLHVVASATGPNSSMPGLHNIKTITS